MSFSPVDGGTLVTLQHYGWERFEAEAAELREAYDDGWDVVLGRLEAFLADSR